MLRSRGESPWRPSMWFVNFVLIAGVLVASLVLGCASYLEHAAPAVKVVDQVPLPMPRPKLAARERSRESQEQEIVVMPKTTEVPHKKGAHHRKERKISTW